MARPPKDPDDRMTSILKLPLTADQKKKIAEAAKLDQMELATWARPILVRAAEDRLARVRRKPARDKDLEDSV